FLWQRKENDRGRAALISTAQCKKIRNESGDGCDILSSLNLIGDDAACNGPAGVEAVQKLSCARIDGGKVSSDFAGEEHSAGCNRHSSEKRFRGGVAPAFAAIGGVERRQPSESLIPRIERRRTTQVKTLVVLWSLFVFFNDVAPVVGRLK